MRSGFIRAIRYAAFAACGALLASPALAQQGRILEAKQIYALIFKAKPSYSVATIDYTFRFKNPGDRQHLIEDMSKARMCEV
jgi:hypothetical protein